MKKYIVLFVVLLSSVQFVSAQVVNEPLKNEVYTFLSVLAQKGVLANYNDLVKPLSRKYIARKLVEAQNNSSRLTNLQKKELKFYFKEYGYEIEHYTKAGIKKNSLEQKYNSNKSKKTKRDLLDKSWEFDVLKPKGHTKVIKEEMAIFKYDWYDRFRPFYYQSPNVLVNINPIVGYEIGNWEKENYRNRMLGANINGYLGNFLGFGFSLTQTRQSPRVKNFLYNAFSKNTTIDLQLSDAHRLDHSALNVHLGVDWGWGTFSLGKDLMNWGYAENGKIVISEKAPSFPYIRLDIHPTNWFSFNYIHAWLNSDVIDSNAIYSTLRYRYGKNQKRITYISKYLASHSVKITPIKGLDLSIGESIVYADNLQFIYLIPIMFFDIADEYIGRHNNYAGGSTQLFLAVSSRNHIKNTHLYGSFFADELTPDDLFDPKKQYYKFAFTLGSSVVDFPFDNLTLRAEFTKVYPGNYRHFIPTLNYTSSSSLVGHWIGDNGDLIYGAIDYRILRGLNIKIWGQYIRKGTEAKGNRAYKIQIPQPPFLFTDRISDRKNYRYYGIETKYQITHDLYIKAHYQYIEFEQAKSETEFNTKLYRDFSMVIGYGI